jgi:hypothetical protein
VANLILRRILIFSGILLGGLVLLFCITDIVMVALTGGFLTFVKSAKPPPPAAAKPATTHNK